MSEFIGSRISLISRSDIRYVGRLHDINSENHTVALEQVVSHGTEGRRGDPAKEIAGSENVYEYIVFRGGDVKDLRIEETASQPRPQVPDDPAILGSSNRRPPPPNYATRNPQPPSQFQQTLPPYYYPPPQAQGQYGPGPYPQGAAMYGAYPPQGQSGLGPVPSGIPQGQLRQQSPQSQQQQPPQQQSQAQPLQQAQLAPQQTQPTGPQNKAPFQVLIRHTPSRQPQSQPQQVNHGSMQQQTPTAQTSVRQSQPPMQQSASVENGDLSAPHAPVHQPSNEEKESPTPPSQENGSIPTPPVSAAQNTRASAGQKTHGAIVPALPLPSHSRQPRSPASSLAQPVPRTAGPGTESLAVTPMPNDTNAAVQDLANKVNQLAMKTAGPGPANVATNAASTPANSNYNGPSAEHHPERRPGIGGFVPRGRGYPRVGFRHVRKVEVPSTDYDFESANAKFNKSDLVKEVTAGGEEEKVANVESPTSGTNGTADGNNDDVVIPPPTKGFYNKGSSFFDNISCENKERAEAKDGDKPRGGAVWRGEEQKKNLETFGQGSVDGGSHFRGRWGRGRGRGRGRYGRGHLMGIGGGPRGGGHYGGTVAGGAN